MVIILLREGLAEDTVERHVGADAELTVAAELLHGVVGGAVALAHVTHRGDTGGKALALGFQSGFALLFLGVINLAPQSEVDVAANHAGQLTVNHFHFIHRELGGILGTIDA